MTALLGILLAFAAGLAIVTAYYVFVALVEIMAGRYLNDRPMALEKVPDFDKFRTAV